MDRFNSILNIDKEGISEIKICQKKLSKKEHRDIHETMEESFKNMTNTNSFNIRGSERKDIENGIEVIFEKIMAENFPELIRDSNPTI